MQLTRFLHEPDNTRVSIRHAWGTSVTVVGGVGWVGEWVVVGRWVGGGGGGGGGGGVGGCGDVIYVF